MIRRSLPCELDDLVPRPRRGTPPSSPRARPRAERRNAPCTSSEWAAPRPSACCDAGSRGTRARAAPVGTAGEVIQAALERPGQRGGATRAFRKNDQRLASARAGSSSGASGSAVRVLTRAVDQHGAQRLRRDVLAQAAAPIVARGDRMRVLPQPHGNAAQIASVSTWLVWLANRCAGGLRAAADPTRISADEQPARGRRASTADGRMAQSYVLSRARARAVASQPRVAHVSRAPSAMIQAATVSAQCDPASDFTAPSTHPRHHAMRCGFASGPRKSCGSPNVPPSTRMYAVTAAASAPSQPSQPRRPRSPAPR